MNPDMNPDCKDDGAPQEIPLTEMTPAQLYDRLELLRRRRQHLLDSYIYSEAEIIRIEIRKVRAIIERARR
jgi:hypothetical protein